MAALALALLFAPPAIGHPASRPLPWRRAHSRRTQSDALNAYNEAVKNFEAILGQRRAQINSKQPLPNLPGQALYLARNKMLSAYKDLTDALPSKIGGPNKYEIPPAYFNVATEPLLDEYTEAFRCDAGAARQRAKIGYPVQGRRRSGNGDCARQRPRCRQCRSGGPHQPRAVLCRDQWQSNHRQCALEQIQGQPANRHIRRPERPQEMGGDKAVDRGL